MQPDDIKWRRFFGSVLIGGPVLGAIILLLISQQPRALLIMAAIFAVPMLLGVWLLFGKHDERSGR
jgi:uncharacterized membrane protein YccC